MALEFQRPPDWLIQDYMNRKSPVVEGLDATAKIAQIYMQEKARREGLQLQQQEGQRQQEELRMKQREQFYNYGDVSSLPQEQASQIGQPVQGPVTEEGMAPQGSPLIARFNEFLAKNQTGIKGRERDLAKEPTSLEQILTQKVRSGEMTLEDALDAKAKSSPSMIIHETKQAGEREKEKGLKDSTIRQADLVISRINEAAGGVSNWTAGVGSALSAIPGTPARNLSGVVDSIKANLGFEALQEMRRNSPTGGALGQVAVQELNMLQSTVASLDRGQSPEQLKRNLLKVKEHVENWKKAVGGTIANTSDRVQQGGGWSYVGKE